MPLNPVNGRGLGDESYDPIWAAALDLGMTPLLHVGFGWPKIDPDWLRVGDHFDPRMSLGMSVALMHSLPQTVLSHMVHRGVFDRFPELVILCEEFGLDWIGGWIDALGPKTRAGTPTGNIFFGWPHKAEPEELLDKNIRFSPLNGQLVSKVVDEFGPGLVCFASDYPHFEGIAQDWEYFDRDLDDRDADVKRRFYSANAAPLFVA